MINHPTYDDFWKLRNPDFSKIQVPVFTVGALHKVGLHLRGVVRGYEEVSTPKKMMLIHGVMDGDEMAVYNYPEMRLLMLRWYDHWLKDNDTGFMDEPPVSIFVRGADEYRPEDDWPIPRTEYRKLYFHPGPSTSSHESLNDGRLSWEPPAAAASSFTYSYPDEDWTHFTGGGTAPIEDGIVHFTRHIPTLVSRAARGQPRGVRQHRPRPVRLVRPEQHRLLLPPRGPGSGRGAGARPSAQGLHPDARLAQGVACGDQERGAEQARPAVLPAQRAQAYRAGRGVPVRDRGLAEHATSSRRGTASAWTSPAAIHRAVDFGGHYYGVKVGSDTYYHDADHPYRLVLPVVPRP